MRRPFFLYDRHIWIPACAGLTNDVENRQSRAGGIQQMGNIMIDIERHGDCAVLKFNRPDALNALNADGLSALEEALKELATSDARALIVTGAGDRAYCAGADINELGPRTPGQVRAAARRGQAIGLQIENLPFLLYRRH